VPLDLSHDIELVAHIRLVFIWPDFLNGGSADAMQFEWSFCFIDNLSLLVSDNGIANTFS
jgi:hypothetical protein